ncbi:MAG: TonB-dependent receptor [Pseudomonadota bacterium]
MKTRLLTTSALFLGSLAAPLAVAQETDEAQTRTLQTVTVTATKREQTLQDVPVAVSVVDDSVIEKAEILDLRDLQSVVPSFSVGQLQSSANTNFIIRGFGNGANNAGIEPSVGVFIDGVYRSRSAAQIADLPNLQRVEVLRGPQSTLFGKNASAGVISIVTQAPQFDWEGNIEGTVSNFNGYRAKGYVTGPISDTVAFSLGGNYNVRDGYAEDVVRDVDINERNRWGVRGELLFEPSPDLSFRLIGDYDEIDEICCVAGNLVNGPTGGIIQALVDPTGQVPAVFFEDPYSYEVAYNFDSENIVENAGVSLQADYTVNDNVSLTSITSFRTSDLEQNADSDFTAADIIGQNSNVTNIETFSQELRLDFTGDGPIDILLGAYYFDETVEIENEFLAGADYRAYLDILTAVGANPGLPADQVVGGVLLGAISSPIADLESGLGLPAGTFAAAGTGTLESFGQDNTAFSVFTSLDYRFTDRLTGTIGLNYTRDEKDAFGQGLTTEPLSTLDLNQTGYAVVLSGLLAQQGVDVTDPVAIGGFIQANPQAYGALQQGALGVINSANPLGGLSPVQFLPQFLNYPNAVESGSSNDEDVSFNLRLAFDASDNVNVYISYATGFKATSWNLSRDARPFPADFVPGSTIVDPFTGQVVQAAPGSAIQNAGLAVPNLTTGTRFAGPEEAEVIEIGVKASFDTFAFNLALFDQTIEGFQSNVFTGTGFALANAGEQSTQGLEIDATWSPIEGLTLGFAGTFLDPIYDSFEGAAEGDITGTVPSGIAETALSTSALYEWPATSALDAFVRADWQYESDSAFFDGGPTADNNILFDDAFGRDVNNVNASAGITTEGGLGVTVWGRNIFNHERVTTAFPSVAQGGSISGYPNQPATYGVTVRKAF